MAEKRLSSPCSAGSWLLLLLAMVNMSVLGEGLTKVNDIHVWVPVRHLLDQLSSPCISHGEPKSVSV